MKPLFIPLKREFWNAFMTGEKDTEFRRYGPRWNERTCPVGRPVTLSLGYGKKHRAQGEVVMFAKTSVLTEGFKKCYGEVAPGTLMACIGVKLDRFKR